jgi:enamine deaminase RidA (YjgF/YER057c/UK114 family)
VSIERIDTGKRMSQVVIHGDTVYLAGQVAENAANPSVTEQTRDVLCQIEALLAKAGSDKSKLLSATIYLPNIADFDAMNEAWDAWVTPGHTPARACVEARLAGSDLRVEISVIAAR